MSLDASGCVRTHSKSFGNFSPNFFVFCILEGVFELGAYVRIDAWPPTLSVFRKKFSSFPENYNSALPPAAQLKPPYYGL